MGRYVLDLHEIGQAQVAVAGGKGAHLGSFRGWRPFASRPGAL